MSQQEGRPCRGLLLKAVLVQKSSRLTWGAAEREQEGVAGWALAVVMGWEAWAERGWGAGVGTGWEAWAERG